MGERQFQITVRGQRLLASWVWSSAAEGLVFTKTSAPPSFPVAPSISGTPQVGETLTASDGTVLNGVVIGRAWLRDGDEISGETGTTYELVEADFGTLIGLRVDADGIGGPASATADEVGT